MNESEITLQSILRILTRRWKPVIGVSILVLIVVYIATQMFLVDKYTASVTLLVSKSKVGDRVGPTDDTSYELDTFLHLINSRDTLKDVQEELNLDGPPLHLSLREFEDSIHVQQLRNTDLLELEVTLSDPALAASAANLLAASAADKNYQLLLGDSNISRRMFREEVQSAHQVLIRAASDLSEYMSRCRTSPSEDYVKSAQEALWKLKQDYAYTTALRDQSRAKMNALSRIVSMEEPTRILKRTISDDQDIFELVNEEAMGAAVPDILKLKVDTENVNFAYDKAKSELIDASKEYFGAAAHIKTMAEEIQKVQGEIRIAEQELAEKKRLEEELKIASFAYEDISRKNAETKTQIASQRQDLVVIEHATVPTDPSGPKRLLTAVSAALFAFLAALFLSMAYDLYMAVDSGGS